MSINDKSPRCPHVPACPGATAVDHAAARVLSEHSEQGWSLLCNGVVLFTDVGELTPDGHAVCARRTAHLRVLLPA